MMADPRILILDEATSAVDAITEERIRKALAALLKGRTSIIIAHRLSTIRNANAVLVIDRGRIVERGIHDDLAASGGAYSVLYKQFIQA
jgi:ATP-binding cassette subfamily B protein